MSTQYRDGTWSDIEPIPEAIDTFMEAVNDGSAKALVVGTKQEILQAQDNDADRKAIEELTRRVDMMEAKQGDSWLVLPSKQELRTILGDK